jgi:serine/threonine protein kinase
MHPSTVYCDTCGAANRPQARFCITCGQAMAAASSLPPTVQAAPIAPSLPPTVLARSTASSSSPTGRLPANSLLNQRYRILRQLGQGGMGAVYQAEDTRLGDQLVAVKEMSQSSLKSQQAITEATQAFRSEAIMLARLRHSHLPRIYDHFEEGGRWYLVMDFIEGETLEDYLTTAGGKLPVQKVLDIGIQLATVLDYLHSHRSPIIFRDLKPANIMRTPDGDLFLIDFGIARHFKPGQAKDTVAYGSAGYAAPEQYGKAQTTPRSDIYSLGATLHHLLTGLDPSQSPFVFAPLSSTLIPAELATLIMRMVKTEAKQRPAKMADVKQELQRIAAHPTGSQLPPTQYVSGSSLPPTQLAVPTPPQPSPVVQRKPVPPAQPPVVSPPSPPKPVKASPPRGTVLCTYSGHSHVVKALAWSSDSTRIASAGYDKTVQVWQAP